MPASLHTWNRAWHVEPEPNCAGNAFHCAPVRRRYTIPDRIVRLGIGGRPRLGPFGTGGRSASTCSHSASGISANLVSTRRVDHERSGPAISRDRIGNREAEPGKENGPLRFSGSVLSARRWAALATDPEGGVLVFGGAGTGGQGLSDGDRVPGRLPLTIAAKRPHGVR